MDFLHTAPTIARAHVLIDADGSRVFDVLEDAAAWPKWVPAIKRVTWTSEFPLAVGATRTVDMLAGWTGYEEFITWDRGHEMAFRFNAVSKPGLQAFAEHYVVSPISGGRSLLEWTMAMKADGPGAKIAPVTGKVISFGLQQMLRKFRKLVESR